MTEIYDNHGEPAAGPGSLDTSRKKYLPLGIDFTGLNCLVVGGGQVGLRKILTLLDHGAVVTVLSPEILPEISDLAGRGEVAWIERAYSPSLIAESVFIIAATDDPELNVRIGEDAGKKGRLFCVVSPGSASRVIFPATFRKEYMTISVLSDGRDCRVSQELRNRIRKELSGTEETGGENT